MDWTGFVKGGFVNHGLVRKRAIKAQTEQACKRMLTRVEQGNFSRSRKNGTPKLSDTLRQVIGMSLSTTINLDSRNLNFVPQNKHCRP